VTIPAVQRTFKTFGLPVPTAEAIGAFIGRPPQEYHDWLAAQCPPDMVNAVVAATDRCELALVVEAGELFPGAMDTLLRLQDRGYALAMSSNAPDDYFAEVLDAHGLREYFQPALCRGRRFTGKVDMVAEILRQHSARPLVVIGDRYDDIESARVHGGLAVAVSYGFGRPDEWADADAVVDTAGEIGASVENLVATRQSWASMAQLGQVRKEDATRRYRSRSTM